MKKLIKITLILMCLSIAVLISSPVFAVTLSETQLITNTSISADNFGRGNRFSVEGENLVWYDGRNGNYDIYYYNLTTHETRQLTNDPSDQVQPQVQGNRVVWKDFRSGHAEIYLYDLTTGQEMRIADLNLPSGDYSSTYYWGPSLDGDLIVWSDYRNNYWEAVCYNIETQEMRQITNHLSVNRIRFTSVYNNQIAYIDGVYGNVYLYDYNTGTAKALTNYTSYGPFRPRIYENYVTWEKYNPTTREYDISCVDLRTNEEKLLVSRPGNQSHPKITGTRMVFTDESSDSSDIYLYDFTTDTTEPVVSSSVYEEGGYIEGNKLFWLQENELGLWDIYSATMDGSGGGSEILNIHASILGQSAVSLFTGLFNPAVLTLTAKDNVKATYTASPWMVQDGRGTGAGWYVTISTDDFTSTDGKIIKKDNLNLFTSGLAKAEGADTSSDPSKLFLANGVSMAYAQTLVYAPKDEGMGTFTFTPSFELTLPANSYAGTYTTSVYVSLYESAPAL